ncbi:MAG: cytochrome c oxidase subunit II [Gammaproteobacteria bacterium]|nr:cytochrome c oxidase subunit II [Gammaproteobacteria bacterium]
MSNESLISNGSVWFSAPASDLAQKIDDLFYFIYYGSIFLFVAILIVLVWFIFKYRRTAKRQLATSQITHNNTLEVTWTVVPLLLCIFVFAWGFRDFLKMHVSPVNAKEIYVKAQKWSWSFEYPNDGVVVANKLVVPVNQNIKLRMSSIDVIHSFYLPNFRVKRDVIPNRYSTIWFKPNRIGKFQIFCTEFCGDRHSFMLADLEVLSTEDYNKWIEKEKSSSWDTLTLEEVGKKVFELNCAACHSLDGSELIGPSWKGLYNQEKQFTDGSKMMADDTYLRSSIINPNEKILQGYSPQMPTFKGILTERQIDGVIEFIKTVK